ncbi:hypothetical protein ACFYXH_16765 [Streptomyces sp. NPDC002730]|uniref:hypothetical protein n=1 Tax=Streptomyces sp. NPDC002730 TaxID=3364662 RepID=UPI003688607B
MAVDLSFYTSPLSEEIRDEGRAQGIAQSILLEQRDIAVPVGARERITSCGDPEILRHWLARTITASCAEEIFAEE